MAQHLQRHQHLPPVGLQEDQAVTRQPSRLPGQMQVVEEDDLECQEGEGEVCPAYSRVILEHTVRLFCISLLG